jgi:hypothetical protein
MTLGKQVRLFLADGTPGGLVTAEIMNWTGHVIAAPRSELATLLKRPEVGRTGIYLLLGDDPEAPGNPLAYVGEGDDVGKRLYQHSRDSAKDFWDRAVVLTNKDMNVTKAHARYLEARFIALAIEAGRARLVNSTAPAPLALSEADVSDMEFFVEQAKIILPVLGVNLLRSTRLLGPVAPGIPTKEASPVFSLSVKGETNATAQEIDGEFIVREGSLGRPEWSYADNAAYKKLRDRLEADGVLVKTLDGKSVRFMRDYVFASPSAAAAVVLGRNSNGRSEWKVEGTKTSYAAWQESLLPPAAPSTPSDETT